jgi:hypothetical protein
MARVWGTKDGSALSTLPREEMEKRELINIRCLNHDTYDIISDAPADRRQARLRRVTPAKGSDPNDQFLHGHGSVRTMVRGKLPAGAARGFLRAPVS